jgi:hypothetical protein
MLAPDADCVSLAARHSCCAHPHMSAPAGSLALHTKPWAFHTIHLMHDGGSLEDSGRRCAAAGLLPRHWWLVALMDTGVLV